MFRGKIYGCGRGAVRVDGRSQRAVARESGLSRETVLARSHLRGQGENKKHSVLCLCGMPEKLAHPVGVQDVHLTLCVLRDYNSRNKIRFQESPVHVLLKHDLEVERDVLAQVVFNLSLAFDYVTDAVESVLVEGAYLCVGIDICGGEDLCRARVTDSKDVCESDAHLFVIRDIDSGNTCHGVPFRLGS